MNREVITIVESYNCRYCDKSLNSEQALRQHEILHSSNLRFQCRYCDKILNTLATLTRHEETHTTVAITVATSGDKDLLCPFCDQTFQDKDPLVNHITKLHALQLSTVAGSPLAPIQHHPIQHQQVQSIQQQPIQTIQGPPDRKTSYLSTVATSQQPTVTAQPPTKTTGRNYSNASNSKGENYVSTTTRTSRGEGSKEARFQCGYCDKSFATPSKVKRHILTHTGEKPFVCQFCQRGFSQKVHMMEHISKHHADESLKAQQEAAAAAAAQAAAAQAAAPAPLIKTLPSNKTLYATQTIATTPLISNTPNQPQIRLQPAAPQTIVATQPSNTVVSYARAPLPPSAIVSAVPVTAITTAVSSLPAQIVAAQPSQTFTTARQHQQTQSQTLTAALADTTGAVQIPLAGNSYIVAEFSMPDSNMSTSPPAHHQSHHQVVDTTNSHIISGSKSPDIMAIPMTQHQLTAEFGGGGSPSSSLTKPGEGPFLSQAAAGSYQVVQSSDKPFPCTHCSADFIRQSNLSVHMMKVHGEAVEIRTHQCAYCDKRFRYPNKKRLHEMTHTGEKPNICQFCSLGFFKKSRLKCHLTKVHGIPEDDLNSPNSQYLQNPSSTTNPTHTVMKSVTLNNSTINLVGSNNGTQTISAGGDHFCQYCQKPFSNRADLLLHERQEALEFEQLHDMFEDGELTGFEVGNSQTDIIQNALLTAGIENGLGSPSVTDSDSVVTISEADIDSFSIGFIPDGNWTSEVSTNLPTSNTPGDPFSPAGLQPLDLNINTSDGHTVVCSSTATSANDLAISGAIYTTSDYKTGLVLSEATPGSLGDINQMWETTVALSGAVPSSSIIKTEPMLSSTAHGEIFTTSSSANTPLNSIYTTETFTIPAGGLTQEVLNNSIISISGNGAHIINGADLDLSKLQMIPHFWNKPWKAGGFTVSAQQLLDQDTLTTTFQPANLTTSTANTIIKQLPSTQLGQWQDDASLPAGWKVRHGSVNNGNKVMETLYMAPDGAQYRTKWKVVEWMESSGLYSQDEIDAVRNTITTPKTPDSSGVSASQGMIVREKTDKLKREWKEDDPTVPSGWKVAWTTTSDNRAKIAFMSPDGKIFHSRKSALQHMLAEGTYDQAEIEKMTKGLNVLLNVGDEWKAGDRSLPEGWKIRSHQWWCQKRNSHRIHYEFLSPQNEFFKSRKAVVEHMTADGGYTVEQIDMVKNATQQMAGGSQADKNKRNINNRVTTITATNNNNSVSSMNAFSLSSPTSSTTVAAAASTTTVSPPPPTSSGNNTVLIGGNSYATSLSGWKVGNPTLPVGWRIKKHEYANQNVWFYMSPKGEIIKSRRGVIEYMFDEPGNAYSDRDFSIVINGGKQRKSALQEFYESKINKKCTLKKKKRLPGQRHAGGEEPDLVDLDLADSSDDNLGDDGIMVVGTVSRNSTDSTKFVSSGNNSQFFTSMSTVSAGGTTSISTGGAIMLNKKPKTEKELILPTRRSGRVQKRKRLSSSEEEENGSGEFSEVDLIEPDFKKMKHPIKLENLSKLHFTATSSASGSTGNLIGLSNNQHNVFLKEEVKSELKSEDIEVSSVDDTTGTVIHLKDEHDDGTDQPHQLPDSQGSELNHHSHPGGTILISSGHAGNLSDLDTFEVVTKSGVAGVGNIVTTGSGVIVSGTGSILDGARIVSVSNANSLTSSGGNPATSTVVVSTAAGPQMVTMLSEFVPSVAD